MLFNDVHFSCKLLIGILFRFCTLCHRSAVNDLRLFQFYLGGPVPLDQLDLRNAGLLLLLLLSMQLLNDISMMAILYLRKTDPAKLLNVFSTGVELASVLIAVLVALVFVNMRIEVLVLLLVVLSLGMVFLKQFAEMRNELEVLVEQRTEELRL